METAPERKFGGSALELLSEITPYTSIQFLGQDTRIGLAMVNIKNGELNV